MDIPVQVERVGASPPRYRAKVGLPFEVVAEGDSHSEAIKAIRTNLENKIAEGTIIESIAVDAKADPFLAFAGTLPNDALTASWIDAMKEYREAVDRDEAIE